MKDENFDITKLSGDDMREYVRVVDSTPPDLKLVCVKLFSGVPRVGMYTLSRQPTEYERAHILLKMTYACLRSAVIWDDNDEPIEV